MVMENNQSFKEKLINKGYKVTNQREIILDVIRKNEGKHLDTEEIYDLVKVSLPGVGIATVYRTLALLEEMDIINKIDLGAGRWKYEIDRNGESHKHHHLICSVCGEVTEVEEDFLERLEDLISSKYDFLINDHSLKFYGCCSKCKSK